MTAIFFVFAAGFGGGLRYLIELRFPPIGSRAFPRATLFVNALGTFILGFSTGLSENAQLIVGTALCGALTTFSGVALQLQRRFAAGANLQAIKYLIFMVALCLGMAQLGILLSEFMSR